MCEDFAMNFGDKITGCCVTTVRHPTLPFSPQIFLIKNMTVVPYPPYFSLFPRLNMQLTGRHFDTVEVIEAMLNTLTENDFQDAFKLAEAPGTVYTR
jgi:hypothetical protein